MKVLITGICGFAGRRIAESLQDHCEGSGLQLAGLDNLSRAGSWLNREPLLRRGIAVYHGDVRQPSDIEAVGPVDWVIDAAANPSVLAGVDGKSSSRQVVDHNLLGTIHLLEHCRAARAGFTLLSTSRVYGIEPLSQLKMDVVDGAFRPAVDGGFPAGFSSLGVTEGFSTSAPVSLYGATKLASEVLALEYGSCFDFPVWINRCGVLAGPGQFGKADQGIFSYWIHSWARRRPLRYVGFGGSGHQVRDCLDPRDLAAVLWRQMDSQDSSCPKVMNFGGGLENSTSLCQLSHWCRERLGGHEVMPGAVERPFDIPWMVMDCREAERVWNWKPRTSLPEILEAIAEHAESHPDWLDLAAS